MRRHERLRESLSRGLTPGCRRSPGSSDLAEQAQLQDRDVSARSPGWRRWRSMMFIADP
jgi:hypothetical protein